MGFVCEQSEVRSLLEFQNHALLMICRLRATWWRRQIYSKGMASNLKALLQKHKAVFESFPDAEVSKAVPALLQESGTTLGQFDRQITRLAGGSPPDFPMPDEDVYYRWASSHKMLENIKVPFLALNADDDPIVSVLPVYSEDHLIGPWVVFGVTRGGGHLGWFEEGSVPSNPRRWYRRPVLEWLHAMGSDIEHPKRRYKQLREIDGFLKEEGRDDIGCKELQDGGHIIGIEHEDGLLAGL